MSPAPRRPLMTTMLKVRPNSTNRSMKNREAPACTMTGSVVKIIIRYWRTKSAPILMDIEISSDTFSECMQTRSADSGSPLPMW